MTVCFHTFGPSTFWVFFHWDPVDWILTSTFSHEIWKSPLLWKRPSTLKTIHFGCLHYMKFKNLFSTELRFKLHQSWCPCHVVPRYFRYFPWIRKIMQIFQIWKNCRCRICNFYDCLLCKVSLPISMDYVRSPLLDKHPRLASPSMAFQTHWSPVKYTVQAENIRSLGWK